MTLQRRLLAVALASAVMLVPACQQQQAADPTADPTAETKADDRIPVGDDSGETVGYMLESDLRALPSEGDQQTGRVPVYDYETGDVVGHFEVGSGGGFEPADP